MILTQLPKEMLPIDVELGMEDDHIFDPEDPASRVVVKDVVQDLITKQRVIRTWMDDEEE